MTFIFFIMLLESDTTSTLAKTKKAQHFYFKLARLSFVSNCFFHFSFFSLTFSSLSRKTVACFTAPRFSNNLCIKSSLA